MVEYFFAADHHFDHANIIQFCNRPFETVDEMNEVLITRHNSIVKKEDMVIVAGDFSFANKKRTFTEFINKLNGNFVFLRGSHDRWMGKHGGNFHEIWERTIQKQKIVVCHYAMRTWAASHYNSWQLYGHSHGTLEPVGKQWDIGVDTNDFYPYSFEQIKDIMSKRPDNPNLITKR
jgi:calcineurin-like phosphoesterase family protein